MYTRAILAIFTHPFLRLQRKGDFFTLPPSKMMFSPWRIFYLKTICSMILVILYVYMYLLCVICFVPFKGSLCILIVLNHGTLYERNAICHPHFFSVRFLLYVLTRKSHINSCSRGNVVKMLSV